MLGLDRKKQQHFLYGLKLQFGKSEYITEVPPGSSICSWFSMGSLHLIELDYKQNQFGMNCIHSEDSSAPKCILRLNV